MYMADVYALAIHIYIYRPVCVIAFIRIWSCTHFSFSLNKIAFSSLT